MFYLILARMPLFSVVLPTYNRAAWLRGAIQSVLEQTFKDFELIVVDDGSTDNTREIVSSFNDRRIVYMYQENKERSAARNAGILRASGSYVCFLDSDDLYLPWHLEILSQAIEALKPSADFVFTDIDEKRNSGKYNLKPEFKLDKVTPLSQEKAFEFFLLNPVVCMRWCVKKEVILGCLFDEKFRIGEDTELLTRLAAANTGIFHLKEVSVIYTEHDDRTVNSELSYFNNIELINYIFSSNPLARNKKHLKETCLHGNYMALVRCLTQASRRKEALKYLIKACLSKPRYNFREKIYLCLKNLSLIT